MCLFSQYIFSEIYSEKDHVENQNDVRVHHWERHVYLVMELLIQAHQYRLVQMKYMIAQHHQQALKIGKFNCVTHNQIKILIFIFPTLLSIKKKTKK